MAEPERKLGPYTLVSKIGRGAFGVVWLGEKRSSIATTRFALKLPRDEDIDLDAFKQEAAIWLQASGHPNVVPMIEADIYDDQVVIVSEYVNDGSLASWIAQHGGRAPSIEAACELIEGVLSGLAHLHGRHIIHRDLKPDNILLQHETPRLADFGIARLLKSGSYSTNISGTLAYMAPEAFDGKRNEQTDVWSAGVIFYQLLSGHLPYDQSDMASFVGAIMRHDPPPLPEHVPEVLRNIVVKAMHREPAERYASAKEMRRDLREAEHRLWQGEQQPSAQVPVAPPPERIPHPTVPYRAPVETEKITPAMIPKPSTPPAQVSIGKPRKSPSPLWFLVTAAVLVLGILLSVGIYGIYRLVSAKKVADTSKLTFAFKQTLTGHNDNVWSVAFSPDGKTLASGGGDSKVKLWDVQTGALKQTLTGHNDLIWSVAFSPDGKLLASGSRDLTVKLWQVSSGTLVQTINAHSVFVRTVAFSPDGKTLATSSDDKSVKLWDVQTGTLKLTLPLSTSPVNAVSFSPDGSLLATGGDDMNVRLWDAKSGVLQRALSGHATLIWTVSFAPDGKTLASASRDTTIKLWDVASGTLKQTLTGHGGGVNSVKYSPDGSTLVSVSDDKVVKIWDARTGTLKQSLTGHEKDIYALAISPDGNMIASGGLDKTIKLWQGK